MLANHVQFWAFNSRSYIPFWKSIALSTLNNIFIVCATALYQKDSSWIFFSRSPRLSCYFSHFRWSAVAIPSYPYHLTHRTEKTPQFLTCASCNLRFDAISVLLVRFTYLAVWNSFSNSVSWCVVKLVRFVPFSSTTFFLGTAKGKHVENHRG